MTLSWLKLALSWSELALSWSEFEGPKWPKFEGFEPSFGGTKLPTFEVSTCPTFGGPKWLALKELRGPDLKVLSDLKNGVCYHGHMGHTKIPCSHH